MAGLDFFLDYLVIFMTAVIVLAGVPLAVATAAGVVVSFLQAITQVQDQTLGQTVKIVVIALTFLLVSGFLVAPLYQSTVSVFDTFWQAP